MRWTRRIILERDTVVGLEATAVDLVDGEQRRLGVFILVLRHANLNIEIALCERAGNRGAANVLDVSFRKEALQPRFDFFEQPRGRLCPGYLRNVGRGIRERTGCCFASRTDPLGLGICI